MALQAGVRCAAALEQELEGSFFSCCCYAIAHTSHNWSAFAEFDDSLRKGIRRGPPRKVSSAINSRAKATAAIFAVACPLFASYYCLIAFSTASVAARHFFLTFHHHQQRQVAQTVRFLV